MKNLSSTIIFFGLFVSTFTRAAEPIISKAPLADTPGYFLQLVSGLGVVLLSILALAWLLKRINRLPNRDLKALELVASLSVGQRERVVIVRAGTTELILGVAPGNISRLGVMSGNTVSEQEEPSESITSMQSDPTEEQHKDAFSALIAKVRKDTSA